MKIYCYDLDCLVQGGSQGGFTIYLVGKKNVYLPIMWKSEKLRRLVKSAMAVETLIQVEALKACFCLSNLLSVILYCEPNDNKNIKIKCFTDNHQLIQLDLRTEIALLRVTNRNCIIKRNSQQKRGN